MNTEIAAAKGHLLTFEDGEVHLGGKLVPGLLQSLNVQGNVRFDEQKIDGASGQKRTPAGFEDANITIDLLLLTNEDGTCYDKLVELNALFQGVDSKANPQILTVVNRHLTARGIRQVVFAHLSSDESNCTDEIWTTLGFVEHNPPIVRVEKAQAKTKTPKELAAEQAGQAAGGGSLTSPNQPTEDELIIDGR